MSIIYILYISPFDEEQNHGKRARSARSAEIKNGRKGLKGGKESERQSGAICFDVVPTKYNNAEHKGVFSTRRAGKNCCFPLVSIPWRLHES